MGIGLDHRISDRLDEMEAHLDEILSWRGDHGPAGDRRQLLLALDRKLAAMAAALEDEQ